MGLWQGLAVQPVQAATQEGAIGTPARPENIVSDEVLVRYSAGWPDRAVRANFAGHHGLIERRADADTSWFRYKITDGQTPDAKMADLRRQPEVADVAPNIKVQLQWTPSGDELYPQQWALPKISMPAAWDAARGGLSFPNFIATIDSGAPKDANGSGGPELGSFKINGTWYGHNSVGEGTTPLPAGYDPLDFGDCFGHGTFVASVAAATANNGGMAGIAFNTGVMPVRFTNCFGSGTSDDAAAAINWALNTHHVVAINCSFKMEGTDAQLPSLKAAVDRAWSLNVSVVAAAGNDGTSDFSDIAPARWYHAIAVGATGPDDKRGLTPAGAVKECHLNQYGYGVICTTYPPGYSFSNYGAPGLDVSAPGVNILGVMLPDNLMGATAIFTNTKLGTSYFEGTGTSAAAPIVAGTISLMLQKHPGLTALQIKQALWATADKVGGYSYSWATSPCAQSAELGCGRLNAAKAVNYWK